MITLPSQPAPIVPTTTETAKYQHQPLPERFIRVLRLHPAPRFESQLRCSLAPVSLDDKPKYWALSYTWGTDGPSLPIFCVDGPSLALLRITPNCASALKHLRDDTEERTLWVDGICIDQTSLEERSIQVGLMGEVYRNTERVVVWLGESDSTTEKAFNLLKQIGDFRPTQADGLGSRDAVDPVTRTNALQEVHANARELTKGITADKDDFLNLLFERPWFHRMWTVQEVTLPPAPKVDIFCGHFTISWLTVWKATDILAASGYKDTTMGPAMRLLRYISQAMTVHLVPGVREFMKNIDDRKLDMELSLLMILCRPKLATDPKDKAYALYGLLQVLGVQLPVPDYKKPLVDIYTEITTAAIRHDNDLWMLCFAASDNKNPDLPSWVPDWSDEGWGQGDPRQPPDRKKFATTGDYEGESKAEWAFTSNPREIVLRGRIFDTVAMIHNSFSSVHNAITIPELFLNRDAEGRCLVSENLKTFYKTYETLKKWVDTEILDQPLNPTGGLVWGQLKALLFSDADPDDLHGPEADEMRKWIAIMRASEEELTIKSIPLAMKWHATSPPRVGLRDLLSGMFRPSRSQIYEETVKKAARDVPIELRTYLAMVSEGAYGYHCRAAAATEKKAFFQTEIGYPGTAPDNFPGSIRVGGKMALVSGFSVPLILRQEGGSYRLVSHSYLLGMLDNRRAWPGLIDKLESLSLI